MINSFNRFKEYTNQFTDWNASIPNVSPCGYVLFRDGPTTARKLIFRIENYNNDNPMDC